VILALLIAAAALALILAASLARARRDVRRLAGRLDRADGQALASLDIDSFGTLDGIAGRVYRMRSELERRVAAAEWQQTVLQHILNGMGEGVLAIDAERRVVLANRRFIDLFAVEGGFAGRPLAEVVRHAAIFAGFDRALARSEAAERLSVRDRTIEMRAFPMPARDIAAVALFIDITRVEQLEQMRREFIADFSHEARTPLAALRSAVDTFESGNVAPDDDQQLRRIMSRQIGRLERLVADLAELSQIEAGDLTLSRTEVDLRRLVDDVCEDFAARAAQRRLRFAVSGGGARVNVDPMRIQQAVANLVDNAIKYGGEDNTIDIAVCDRGDAAAIRITDHGEGVSPSERERIFRRFYRVDKSRSQLVAGTGLGLAIAKHLVLLHRGNIDVESEPGKGATFVVTLPHSHASSYVHDASPAH
jgi:two-component system, OmpR family, phosphate regulon sensor histidine kinase PhoR